MPAIEPVPYEHLAPELRALIDEQRATRLLSTSIPNQVWGYSPEFSMEMIRRSKHFLQHSQLPPRLLELLRLRLAVFNECRACQMARKSDAVTEADVACLSSDDEHFTPAERTALRFAELFATDHLAIGDALIAELGRHFSKAEIIELGLYLATILGGGRLAHVLRTYDDDDQPPVLHYQGEFAPQ